MKAYCINLDSRPDRWTHMTGQFAAVGMSAERVPAVDARDPAVRAAAAACRPGISGKGLSAGAYACFQSHRSVWQKLVASGDPFAMVLEDDVLLAAGFAQCLGDDWIPHGADLVKLETVGVRVHVDKRGTRPACGRALRRIRSYHSACAAYVLSRGAAERMLRLTEVVADPIDDVLFNPALAPTPPLVVWQMLPAPAVQGDRPIAGQAGADWAAGSIGEHWAAPEGPIGKEPILARLSRRASHELRALANGTRYVVVPFG